jgi:Flp pilus assembly protein TadB
MSITDLLPSLPSLPTVPLLLAGSFCAALLVYLLVSRLDLMLAPAPSKALARYFGRDGESDGVERLGRWLLHRLPGVADFLHLEGHRRWLALRGETPSLAYILGLSLVLAGAGLGLALLTRAPIGLGLVLLGAAYPLVRLRTQAGQVRRAVVRALPELTALMAAELAAGNPPDKALERAGQWGGPLAALIQEAVTQSRIQGRPLLGRGTGGSGGVLLSVVESYDLPALSAFASQVELAARKGAAGPELMAALARTLILEYKEQALRSAESLESRLAVPSVLFFFLPFLFLILTPLVLPVLDVL